MIFVSKQKIRKINYKSDFDFILDIKVCTGLDAEGNSEYAPLGFPDYDFEGVIHCGARTPSYRFGKKGNLTVNCFNDDGRIHVVCDNHGLPPGRLSVEFRSNIHNDIYSNGRKLLVSPFHIDIELVPGPGDCPSIPEIAMVLPFVRGEPMDWSRMTEEERRELTHNVTEAINSGDHLDIITTDEAVEMVRIIWEDDRHTGIPDADIDSESAETQTESLIAIKSKSN